MSRRLALLDNVYNQTGALSAVSVDFSAVYVECLSGTIVAVINGVNIPLDASQGPNVLDVEVQGGTTFEVTGTGRWSGVLFKVR